LRDLGSLEQKLGHRFSDPALLERALTHASTTSSHSNERLEFLGDRVLGLVVAETLHSRYPQESEGALTIRFHALVRAEACARVAEAAGLRAYVRHSGGFDSARAAILSDVCEAVIAALYLDGGMAAARLFIENYWTDMLDDSSLSAEMRDAKTRLQEWAQGRGLPAPAYREIARTGPAHAPRFTIEVSIQDEAPETGEGGSKREAEQEGAAKLLTRVQT
jgi:ribonuclease III